MESPRGVDVGHVCSDPHSCTGGFALLKALDDAHVPPRAAIWVHNSDTDTWKLWIVPHPSIKDKREFYRRIAEIISQKRVDVGGLDASDAEMVAAEHPAVQGLQFLTRAKFARAHFSNVKLEGFYLPDGIILRMEL